MSDEERDYEAEAADYDDYQHDRMVEARLEAPKDRGLHPSRRPGLDIEQEIANIKERGLAPADEKRELYGANLVKYKDQANRTQRHREGQ